MLHEDRFVDKSPAAIHAELLDEELCLCSVRTMYRILKSRNEVRERRNQARRQHYEKPELLAVAPNQVWSWDITKLKGPQAGQLYYLYVIIDIFSRYVVGWMVADHESAELAKRLIRETCKRQQINEKQLKIHSDRGAPMRAKKLSDLLTELGVAKSFSRPHVSNDNPYSESQFKTLKYSQQFPRRFGSYQDAETFCKWFFGWYNDEHYHSGIAMMTPRMVHYGLAAQVNADRQTTLTKAYQKHPERFVRGKPRVQPLPKAAWINPPERKKAAKIFARAKRELQRQLGQKAVPPAVSILSTSVR